jgi:hypothetical protein
MRPPFLFLMVALTGCAAAAPAERPTLRAEAAGPPRIALAYPPAGAVLGGPPTAFLAGRAAVRSGPAGRLDLVLAIDTSGSSCLGVDEPADATGGACAAPGPGTGPAPGRLLDVEIAAARALVGRVDPERTRVGVVSFGEPMARPLHRFAGPDTGFAATRLELAPTADLAAVGRVLEGLAAREPDGPTNLSGALRRATRSLGALPDAAPRRVVALLTNGGPTAPRATDRENLVECLQAADHAAHDGVEALVFATGDAVQEPLAALEIAARTGGAFYPVRDAGSLPALAELVGLESVPELEVRNATTGAAPLQQRIGPDGRFDAVLPLVAGENRIEVRARSQAGLESTRELTVRWAEGARSPALPPRLEARREALRAEELTKVSSRVDALERQAAARTRARLLEEMARERAAARSSAAEQRRALALEADSSGPAAVSAGPQGAAAGAPAE